VHDRFWVIYIISTYRGLIMIKAWIIQNKQNAKLFWSGEHGWVSQKEDCFSDWAKRSMILPANGVWVEVLVSNNG